MNNKWSKAIVGALFGAAGGLFLISNIKSGNFKPVITFFAAIAGYLVCAFLTIIIHESGHLVMGLLTGYRFVSFRISSFLLKMDNGKLRLRRYNIPGTGGQCIMKPPESDMPENVPFVLYHAGGCLFNLLTVVICIIVCLNVRIAGVRLFAAMLGFVNLYLGIVNGIPMNMGVDNDGKNIFNLRRSPEERRKGYNALMIDALQNEGMMLCDIPDKYFDIPDKCVNSFDYMMYFVGCARLLEKLDFAGAADMIGFIADNYNSKVVMNNELMCEYTFCRMALEADKPEIDGLYNKDLRAYVDNTQKYSINRRKLLFLYKLRYENDRAGAENEYEKLIAMKDVYPFTGEFAAEKGIIEYLRSKYA